MNRARKSRIWWVAAAGCLLAAIVNTVFIVAAGNPLSVDTLANRGFPLITLAALITGAMGSLVLSRRPRHPTGRLLAAAGLVTATSLACDAYAFWVLAGGGSGPMPLVLFVSWLSSALGGNITLACFAIILLLASDGALPSPRWRIAVAVTVAGALLMELAPFLEPLNYAANTDPYAATALAHGARLTGLLLLVLAFGASAVSLIRRQRRSTGVHRVQIRWFTTAAALLAFTLGWLVLVQNLPSGDGSYALSILPFMVATLWFPVAIAIAVLGYRLYDIDLIVNRAWLLLGATVFAGLAYVVLVTLVGTSMKGFWASALAAAAVACAFQPLRMRLVRVADRLAYGDQAVPYLALADLSRRLGRTPQATGLIPSVAEACSQATGAVAARVDLFAASGRTATATAPAGVALDEEAAIRFDVRYWGETLGALWVQPATGRGLRRRDMLVLTGFSEQAGVAFRNLRLNSELADRVAELTTVANHLRDSRNRIVCARADELAALERSLARQVAPRLATVAQYLDQLTATERSTTNPAWAVIDSELSTAADELRTLSHGLYPSLLEAEGLGPALRSLLSRRKSSATVAMDPVAHGQRFDRRVESVIYACVAWSLEAGQTLNRIELRTEKRQLVLTLNGAAFESSEELRDLVEGRGGTLHESANALTVRMPLDVPD